MQSETEKLILKELKEIKNKIAQHDKRFDNLESGFDNLEGRFDHLESRFDNLEGKVDGLEGRFDNLEGKVDGLEGRFDKLEERMDERFDELQSSVNLNTRYINQGFQRLSIQRLELEQLKAKAGYVREEKSQKGS